MQDKLIYFPALLLQTQAVSHGSWRLQRYQLDKYCLLGLRPSIMHEQSYLALKLSHEACATTSCLSSSSSVTGLHPVATEPRSGLRL